MRKYSEKLIPTITKLNMELSTEKKQLLQRHLANWSYLSTFLNVENPGIEMTGMLLRMEMNGRKRRDLLNRLTARLMGLVRDEVKREVFEEVFGTSTLQDQAPEGYENA